MMNERAYDLMNEILYTLIKHKAVVVIDNDGDVAIKDLEAWFGGNITPNSINFKLKEWVRDDRR